MPRPCPCPTHQETRGHFGANFIVLVASPLDSSSRGLLRDIYIYTYVHTQTPQPMPTARVDTSRTCEHSPQQEIQNQNNRNRPVLGHRGHSSALGKGWPPGACHASHQLPTMQVH